MVIPTHIEGNIIISSDISIGNLSGDNRLFRGYKLNSMFP